MEVVNLFLGGDFISPTVWAASFHLQGLTLYILYFCVSEPCYGIFNVLTHVKACDCVQGLDKPCKTLRESTCKVDPGEKSLATVENQT